MNCKKDHWVKLEHFKIVHLKEILALDDNVANLKGTKKVLQSSMKKLKVENQKSFDKVNHLKKRIKFEIELYNMA